VDTLQQKINKANKKKNTISDSEDNHIGFSDLSSDEAEDYTQKQEKAAARKELFRLAKTK